MRKKERFSAKTPLLSSLFKKKKDVFLSRRDERKGKERGKKKVQEVLASHNALDNARLLFSTEQEEEKREGTVKDL